MSIGGPHEVLPPHGLLTEGESVVDVPARLVARVRLLSGGGKSDPADARAIALAAQPLTALRAVRAEDDTAVLRLLSDRRDELTQERTRVVNRLHRLLRELRPGGGPSRPWGANIPSAGQAALRRPVGPSRARSSEASIARLGRTKRSEDPADMTKSARTKGIAVFV